MRTPLLLTAALLFAFGPARAAQRSLLLSDFESSGSPGHWTVSSGAFSLSHAHASHGDSSGRFEFDLPSENTPQAAASLTIGPDLLPRNDWARWQSLAFELTNGSPEKVGVVCDLRDSTVRYCHDLFILAPGQTVTARLDVSGLYHRVLPTYATRSEKGEDESPRILSLRISQDRPGRANPLFVDNVRLVADSLQLINPRLCPDPLGGAMVAVACGLNRLARVEARILDSDGHVVKRHFEETKNFYWLWNEAGEDQTIFAGVCRSELLVTDCKWDPATVIRRDLGRFEIAPVEYRPEIAAWQAPTTRKVMLFNNPDPGATVWGLPARGQAAAALRVEMARNEYEGCQVVFRVRDVVRRLRFQVEGLQHTVSGKAFPLEGSQILQVGYVYTRDPQRYEVDYMGWWPDALLPVEEMYAAPGECMPVWINLKTTDRTEPGLYRGRLVVWSEGVHVGEIPLEVNVHSAVLPRGTTIRTAFTTEDQLFAEIHGGVLSDSLEMKYNTIVAEHRLNPDNIYRHKPPAIDMLEHFDKLGQLNAFNLMYVGGRKDLRDRISTDAYLQELAATLDPCVAELRKRGLDKKAYLYGFDEIGPEMYGSMRKVLGFLHQRYPGIPTMTTGYDPTYGYDSGLLDEVDIWVPLTPSYDLERAEATRGRGKDVWWYICISPPHPFANWFVEYPAVEARLIWWMAWQQKVPGFLYYLTNIRHHQDQLMQLTGRNKTNWNPASYRTANGDGCFIYSGPDGPISTIRFENIRDGIEDTELLFLLQKKSGRADGEKLCAQLFRSVKDFSTDVDLFGQVRGKLLEEASGE